MHAFLINREQIIQYDELLKDINNSSFYNYALKSNNLYSFFLNFIIAIATENDIILLDSDLSTSELINSGLGENVNTEKRIKPLYFETIDELLAKIILSKSAITIFTSGTTGQPKKIIHSISTLTKAVRKSDSNIGQIWGFAYNPTHIAGLQVLFQAFSNQNTLVNIFNSSRREVYEAIEKYSITNISATPTFYRLLLPFEKEFLTLKRITFGGEKSDEKLHENIMKIFPNAKINNIYASTEAGSLLVSKGEFFKIPMEFKDKFKIENQELLICKSLLGQSEDLLLEDGYYKTGDLIEFVDETNIFFRFLSRKNELINVGGYKVNPSEVEQAILNMLEVQEVMVYGKPNSVLGNILCAEIKLMDGVSIDESKIRSYLSENIQDFKIPRRIKFVESFLLTRTGKLKRL
ncbi:ANL family adenylate-forming protein [Flavobacterium granuli]|uniref:AMP-binding enzyme n=1 Tax=Flavobacterium granuli TaxID=280093 RepID=A0A1M5SJ28_9FLAO|nr:fatty acid--CoA ligase family protein [Flavobacterium granuli]PRZ21007.1 AMP-binding enzyme [Flavobacterium granuli]SHH38554.1 AMP-binding enzyme C-terminal domain-containing protein [Flavobacterium granuli]